MKKITKLNNGITLISQRMEQTHSVTISVNFRVGELYENNDNNGITHLTEHMYFRRWDDLTQNELYFEMMALGAEITGHTYHDYVSFSITVAPKFFIKAFELIIKCLNKFHWNEDVVIAEKKVVCRQIENDYQSFQKWQNYNYFKNTMYELPIMGTVESVQKLTYNDINAWKDTYFCCNNSCVVITGNYSENNLIIAQEKLVQLNNYGTPAESIISPPKNFNIRNNKNRYTIFSDDNINSDITVFFDVNLKYDYETVRLLSSILGEGCGSVLSMALRERTGTVDDVYTDLMCYCGFNRLSISFNVDNSKFFECMDSLFYTISAFKKCVLKKEYLKAITFFTDNQLMDYDNPETLNKRYVLCDFVLNSIKSEPFELKEKYKSISIEDLQIYSNEILTSNNLSFLIQTNIKEEELTNYLNLLIKNTI